MTVSKYTGDDMDDPNEMIRRAVTRDGRTGYALAKVSGVSQATFSRFMRGERGLTLALASKLVAALGLELTLTKTPASRRKAR